MLARAGLVVGAASALMTCTTVFAAAAAGDAAPAAAALPSCARFHSSGGVHFDSFVVLRAWVQEFRDE